jgi:CubicO group peptidase (beta-lactamase class C family)
VPVDHLLPELADRQVLRRLDGPLDDTEPAKRAITLRDLLTLRMGFGHIMKPGAYPIQKAAGDRQVLSGPPKPQIWPDPDEWSRPPAFPSAAGGLVSTVDDYLAFGRMMLNNGKHGNERILSRPSVELMTTDQLTAEQKAGARIFLGENRGWGFGLSVVTRRDDLSAVPGRFGWDGGLGTSWASDPGEDMVAILLTQTAWTSPSPPGVYHDFWTSAYQAIDD